ncbi:hypothetical protein COO60DRAFT_1512711 [Scenedesmus sp. NREL 46B-D3]|nr:hypothetical protein COO60DRAFT_1512711 [Scenedesmus sp. NREL 46B-D3]
MLYVGAEHLVLSCSLCSSALKCVTCLLAVLIFVQQVYHALTCSSCKSCQLAVQLVLVTYPGCSLRCLLSYSAAAHD